jgi:hypothetical protein
MRDLDLNLVYLRLGQIYKEIDTCKSQVEDIEAEIRLRFEPVLEERDLLRNRVDPYSWESSSLADWN